MVDLKDVGMRIRTARKKMGFTQEQLAEAAGVGTTHISHIETGSGKASLRTLLAIINTLNCSSDELLCMEVRQARPLHYEWLEETLDDCTQQELKLIRDMILALKESLRRHHLGQGEREEN